MLVYGESINLRSYILRDPRFVRKNICVDSWPESWAAVQAKGHNAPKDPNALVECHQWSAGVPIAAITPTSTFGAQVGVTQDHYASILATTQARLHVRYPQFHLDGTAFAGEGSSPSCHGKRLAGLPVLQTHSRGQANRSNAGRIGNLSRQTDQSNVVPKQSGTEAFMYADLLDRDLHRFR